MGIQTPTSTALSLNAVGGRIQSGYPNNNPNRNWELATPYRLYRSDVIRQITHKPNSGEAAFWRWASTKHSNTYRFAWQGGHPPFRFTVLRNDSVVQETTWVRTQSVVNPSMYDHQYPQFGYEFAWQPTTGENGSTINFKVLIESQDGQVLVLDVPIGVDDTRFKYFDAVNGNNTNPGTFESPYQTFGYGYASVTNAQNYIYCYKSGTYNVNNGTAMNDAAFNSTHCKSHVGLGSGVVFNVSQGNFSGGVSDIYLSNFTLTGGRSDKANIRQIDLDVKTTRFHAHKITFDTTVVGSLGNDNPCGIMFWDLTSPNYHEDIAITDCVLSSTSLSQMFAMFQCKNVIVEGCSSNNPTVTAINGGQLIHLKDGVLNATIRHCVFAGNTLEGLLNVASQDWQSCGNVDVHFCKLVNTKASGIVSRWNVQVHTLPMEKPVDYYIQRCSIDAFNSSPFTAEDYHQLGYPVKYSGLLWESTSSTFNGGSNPSTGMVSVGATTLKVADIETVSSTDLGIRGFKISSTLVV